MDPLARSPQNAGEMPPPHVSTATQRMRGFLPLAGASTVGGASADRERFRTLAAA